MWFREFLSFGEDEEEREERRSYEKGRAKKPPLTAIVAKDIEDELDELADGFLSFVGQATNFFVPEASRHKKTTISRPVTVGVIGSGYSQHADLAMPLGRWLAEEGFNILVGCNSGSPMAAIQGFRTVPLEKRTGRAIGLLQHYASTTSVAAKPKSAPRQEEEREINADGAFLFEIPIYLPPEPSLQGGPENQEVRATKADNHADHSLIVSSDMIVALPGEAPVSALVELALQSKKPICLFLGEGARTIRGIDKTIIPRFRHFHDVKRFVLMAVEELFSKEQQQGSPTLLAPTVPTSSTTNLVTTTSEDETAESADPLSPALTITEDMFKDTPEDTPTTPVPSNVDGGVFFANEGARLSDAAAQHMQETRKHSRRDRERRRRSHKRGKGSSSNQAQAMLATPSSSSCDGSISTNTALPLCMPSSPSRRERDMSAGPSPSSISTSSVPVESDRLQPRKGSGKGQLDPASSQDAVDLSELEQALIDSEEDISS